MQHFRWVCYSTLAILVSCMNLRLNKAQIIVRTYNAWRCTYNVHTMYTYNESMGFLFITAWEEEVLTLFYSVQTSSGAHSTSYPTVTGISFPGGNEASPKTGCCYSVSKPKRPSGQKIKFHTHTKQRIKLQYLNRIQWEKEGTSRIILSIPIIWSAFKLFFINAI